MSKTIDDLRRHLPQGKSNTWYEIKNQAGPTATVRIYEEIGFWGITAEDFAAELGEITAGEIEVQINSPGGDVFDGIAIYNTLRAHPANITTRVDGLAASAASVIAQAGDKRVMFSASQMMIHNAWGLSIGDADDMRKYADILEQQNEVIAGIYAQRSGKDADEFLALMKDDTWLTADKTVDLGLADEVIDDPKASLRVPQSLFVAKAMATLPEDMISAAEPLVTLEVPVEQTTVSQSEYDAVVAERDALRTELAEAKPEAKDDAVDVSALPESVQAALREAETLKARVEKMETENRAKAFVAKAAEFGHIAGAAELGPVLEEIDRKAPEAAKALEQYMKAANARIDKGGLYAELGSDGADNGESEAERLIAAEVAKGTPRVDAIRKVFSAHPDLYPAAKVASGE
jgi:ATP-dependent Clp endopeptidase proteolytic subunit ClpP